MVIRAIFYDLDGTLRLNVPEGWHVFSDIANELGLNIQPEDRLRAARWEHYYFAESAEILSDQVSFRDGPAFWVNFGYRQLIVLGASPQQAAELAPVLHQHMNDRYRPVDIIPADLIETLNILKSQGYILGVLSNRRESFSEYLAELGLSEFFSLVVYAGEAGSLKPNPGVFHYLLEKAGVSAQESIYIGDNYYADVVGSRRAGMSPVLLDFNGLFVDPDCPVIKTHSQIFQYLERRR
ncbi:MAG: HAD family hydrolase [Chloroflexi bacterium]|nr:HAD family hydrolase [Chloroflexota bacterium]